MNELIKELAEQADIGWDDKYHWYVSNETMKKFAKLIVWECVESLDDFDDNYLAVYQQHILEHFGIDQ